MILQKEDLSPSQREAIEQLIGRRLLDEEAISLKAFSLDSLPDSERQAARKKLREFLNSDRPGSRTPDEEFEAIFIEAMRSVRPGYTEIR
ncbi:MAG: hypothetical protein WBE76_21480 [Terracidiphilus sp.]